MPGIVSATGVLAFLTDEEPELKVFALQTLNDDIDTVWTEVAAVLTQMYVIFASRLHGVISFTNIASQRGTLRGRVVP
jgi:hypothetical protein